MGQFVEERAHIRYIGNKNYQDNWEHIFGKGKKESSEESINSNTDQTEEQDVWNEDEATRGTGSETHK